MKVQIYTLKTLKKIEIFKLTSIWERTPKLKNSRRNFQKLRLNRFALLKNKARVHLS